MWYKQQIEFAILPRIFKGTHVSYKGQYSFRFELVHQSQQGTITSSYPYLHRQSTNANQSPLGQDRLVGVGAIGRRSNRDALSFTQVQNNRGYFQTKKFQINYENHVEYFGDLCIFKMEYKMKKGQERGKTTLKVEVISHKSTLVDEQGNKHRQKPPNPKPPTLKKLTLKQTSTPVHSHHLQLNPFTHNLLTFHQLELTDNDFFGTVSLFLGSVQLGYRIRNSKLTLCEYLCLENKEKKRLLERRKEYLRGEGEVGRLLGELTAGAFGGVQGFYRGTVGRSVGELGRLCRGYRQMVDIYNTNTKNNKLQYQSTQTHPQPPQQPPSPLQQAQSLLEYPLPSTTPQLATHYQCPDLPTLYFQIHYENSLISQQVKAVWQYMHSWLYGLTVDEFQGMVRVYQGAYDRLWREHCVGFVGRWGLGCGWGVVSWEQALGNVEKYGQEGKQDGSGSKDSESCYSSIKQQNERIDTFKQQDSNIKLKNPKTKLQTNNQYQIRQTLCQPKNTQKASNIKPNNNKNKLNQNDHKNRKIIPQNDEYQIHRFHSPTEFTTQRSNQLTKRLMSPPPFPINQNHHHRTTKSKNKYSLLYPDSQTANLLQLRSERVTAFKTWRAEYLKTQPFHYEADLEHPYLLVENYGFGGVREPRKVRVPGTMGLVVFVHGFKGSQFDLERASEYLLKENQQVDVLRIKTLQSEIDYQIQQMAKIVAKQIKTHIACSITKYDSISIIGYSLGGIISRACLPHLSEYRSQMNIFLTLSSPHLGTHSSDNSFVRLGIWYLTKMNKNTVLEQLHTCRDLNTSSKSYMKMLSERGEIGWFRKVVLVGCYEDQFVPHRSARVEGSEGMVIQEGSRIYTEPESKPCRKSQILNYNHNQPPAHRSPHSHLNPHPNPHPPHRPHHRSPTPNKNSTQAQIHQMAENITRHAKRIERVEVWFDNERKKGAIDRLIGRQSHIQFLDNCVFLRWVFKLYGAEF